MLLWPSAPRLHRQFITILGLALSRMFMYPLNPCVLGWFGVDFKLNFTPTHMEMDTWVFKQGGAWIVGWDIRMDGNII